MALNVAKELAALRRMTVGELRRRYAEVFGETTNSRHKQWLVKRVIWRMQSAAEGGLSERALRRAEELANDADLRVTAPRERKAPEPRPELRVARGTIATSHDCRVPVPGTVITRPYKGRTERVTVLPGGFEHDGEVYPSLSAVAKAITGSHCNGFLFFRLKGKGNGK